MIVKNEEGVLNRCLESVKDIVDEMVVVDTGSTDDTKNIAKSHGAAVYEYAWEDDFAKARNLSISKAGCEWILLLDADEVFNKQDHGKFKNFVHNSKYEGANFLIYNYIGEEGATDISFHYAFRLLRNNGKYKFKGRIHEQIVGIDEESICWSDIIIYHYGYLNQAIEAKNKRERNMPILYRELKEDPTNAYLLFSMGNEYMAKNSLKEAFGYYVQAYRYKEPTQAYCPHLMYRMILCLIEAKEFKQALGVVEEALGLYPESTDIEYCRALVYKNTNAFILAIESLVKCLKMGEPPFGLKFRNGCGTFLSYLQLGDIYLMNEAHEKAIEAYGEALNLNGGLSYVLYKIGKALNKLHEDKDKVTCELLKYFNGIDCAQGRIILSDVLIQEKLYDKAKGIVDETNEGGEDLNFIRCKLFFYQKDYNNATKILYELNEKKSELIYFKEAKTEIRKMIFLTGLMAGGLPHIMEAVNEMKEDRERNTYQLLYHYHKYGYSLVSPIPKNVNPDIILDLMDKMLFMEEVELFDKTLQIFNMVDGGNDILLRLAKLYDKHGYKRLAVKTIFQSVKHFDYLDAQSLSILNKAIKEI